MRHVLMAVAGLLLLSSAFAAPSQRPNIVILYADDMGYGDLAAQNPDSKIPTAIAGAELPEHSADDSHNLLDVWTRNAPSPRSSIVHNTFKDTYAIRHGNWVLIAAKTGAHSKVPPWFDEQNGYAEDPQPGELYDLSADLAQKRNLYAEKPEKVAKLTAMLEQVRRQGQVR